MAYNFENPPLLNTIRPESENIAFIALTVALAMLMIALMRRSRTGNRATALLCVLGGSLAVIFDAQFSVLTLRWFPAIDTTILYTSSGRVVPVFWLLFQAVFVGGGIAWLITGENSTAAKRETWNVVWLFVVLRLLLEIAGVSLGLWSYYGWQPFSVFGVPLWMPILSAVAIVSAARFVRFSLTTHHPSTLLIGVPLSYSITTAMLVWPLILALNHRNSNIVWASVATVATLVMAGILVEVLRRLPSHQSVI